MITFLYGAYGSGKTSHIIDAIKQSVSDGIHTFLIVPEQEAVQAERMVLEALPPSAQLDLEVLNFSRLYNRVCREYGGLSYRYMTKPIKHLMMWQNLRELAPLLEEYGELAGTDASLCELMVNAVNELKACALSPEDLRKAHEKLKRDDPLCAKLRDLELIYASFDRLVTEKYTDSSDDLSKLCDKLREHDFFHGCNVFIDSFSSFTAVEHRVIERIFASADNVTVSIPLPHPECNEIYTLSITSSLKRLKKSADRHHGAQSIVLHGNKRAAAPSLAYLTDNLWRLNIRGDKDTAYNDGSIVAEICENSYAEAEAAAAHISELLREGARCRDIAIVARDPARYRGIIEPAFEKNGIPLFVSEKTDLCALAPVKFILSALRIRRYGWQRSDVIAHVKTGLCGVDTRSVDLFEEYVNAWSIRGSRFTSGDWTMNPDGYQPIQNDRAKDILACANDVRRRITEPLERLFILLDASENIADMCRAMYSYLCETNIGSKLSELSERERARGRLRSAEEFASLYEVLINTLADVGEALGEYEADTEEFYQILKTVFEQTDIGTIPTSIDEVTLGSAATFRAANIKYLFVLGLCESVFPAAVNDRGIFSAAGRETLEQLELELSGNTDSRSSDELMYVLRAFSIPSEKLYLFTVTSEISGESRIPSLAFARVRALFPDLIPHEYSGSDIRYLAGAPKSAAAHVRELRGTPDGEALRIAASEHIPELEARSGAESYSPSEILSSDITSGKQYSDIVLSFSRFEKYVLCPFNYFCSYELKLRESTRARFRFNDIGTFVHYVLEKLLKYAITELDDGSLPDREMLTKKSDEIVNEYIDSIFPTEEQTSARLRHLFDRLKKLSRLVLDNIVEEFEHSKFRPAFFELEADGKDGSPSPMVLIPDDNSYRVTFKGVIDRVDLMKKDGKVYIRVIDYKTGSKTFKPEDLEHGMNLQMLLYLYTLCRNKDNDFARSIGLESGQTATPAGMIYLLAKVPVVTLLDYTDEETVLKSAGSMIERNGLLLCDEDILHDMNDELSTEILAGVQKDKNGLLGGDALISGPQFDELFDQMRAVILKITDAMRSGDASARPLRYGDKDPCTYCASRAICRNMKDTNERSI